MREIYFSDNQLSSIPENFFSDNKELESIYLRNNKISKIQRTLLMGLGESLRVFLWQEIWSSRFLTTVSPLTRNSETKLKLNENFRAKETLSIHNKPFYFLYLNDLNHLMVHKFTYFYFKNSFCSSVSTWNWRKAASLRNYQVQWSALYHDSVCQHWKWHSACCGYSRPH